MRERLERHMSASCPEGVSLQKDLAEPVAQADLENAVHFFG